MLLLAVLNAHAEPLPVAALNKTAKTAAKVARVKVGVGGIFQAGGAFMDQPSDRVSPVDGEELPYSAMAGVSPGGGISFDVRFLNTVGIEVDLIRSIDKARSSYTVGGVEVPFTVTQPAIHVPVLLKIHSPNPILKPNLQLGGQLVFPQSTAVDVDGDLPFGLSSYAEPYVLWMGGIGAELKVPTPKWDVRVPISVRGGFNAPVSNRATERALYAIDPDGRVTGIDFSTEWKYHASITMGLTFYWPN